MGVRHPEVDELDDGCDDDQEEERADESVLLDERDVEQQRGDCDLAYIQHDAKQIHDEVLLCVPETELELEAVETAGAGQGDERQILNDCHPVVSCLV